MWVELLPAVFSCVSSLFELSSTPMICEFLHCAAVAYVIEPLICVTHSLYLCHPIWRSRELCTTGTTPPAVALQPSHEMNKHYNR